MYAKNVAPLERTSSQNPLTENPWRSATEPPAQIVEVITADRAVTWNRGNIE